MVAHGCNGWHLRGRKARKFQMRPGYTVRLCLKTPWAGVYLSGRYKGLSLSSIARKNHGSWFHKWEGIWRENPLALRSALAVKSALAWAGGF